MTLKTDEFIRRFLLHVLPRGFRRASSDFWPLKSSSPLPQKSSARQGNSWAPH